MFFSLPLLLDVLLSCFRCVFLFFSLSIYLYLFLLYTHSLLLCVFHSQFRANFNDPLIGPDPDISDAGWKICLTENFGVAFFVFSG